MPLFSLLPPVQLNGSRRFRSNPTASPWRGRISLAGYSLQKFNKVLLRSLNNFVETFVRAAVFKMYMSAIAETLGTDLFLSAPMRGRMEAHLEELKERLLKPIVA